jgi:hypothetical protein
MLSTSCSLIFDSSLCFACSADQHHAVLPSFLLPEIVQNLADLVVASGCKNVYIFSRQISNLISAFLLWAF